MSLSEGNSPALIRGDVGASGSDSLSLAVDMMREMSQQTDPQVMVSVFRQRANRLYGGDAALSLSRRGLKSPQFRITRNSRWKEDINPWLQPEKLPLLKGGILSELIYGDAPRLLDDVAVPVSDPAFDYLRGVRSMVALPLYEGGVALNMVVRTSPDPSAFSGMRVADALLTANLFGRATSSLLAAQKLQAAYSELDLEMRRVAELQRALLPDRLPSIPGVDVAASYKTATRAGGDYYDFLDLGDGRWGLWIADVSGHGAPAAVIMAMLRTMLHSEAQHHSTPGELLSFLNRKTAAQASRYEGMFVTAFYGVFEPRDGSLRYACAGHNPPLLVDRRIQVRELDEAQALPLGVDDSAEFAESADRLTQGDTLLLYTDGITEATNVAGTAYGRDRLLSCVREDVPNAQHIIDCVTYKLIGFTDGLPQHDDQTLVAIRKR